MKYLTNIDLNKNELQNARIQNLASAPSAPVVGQVYYNTVDLTAYIWNGTVWIATDAAKVADASIPLAKLNDLAGTVQGYTLDQFADAAADVGMGGFKITNVATPVADTDAANKGYVDNVVAGISWKDEVRVATTAAGTLATSFANGSTVDGVVLVTNDRILIKNQASATENGIYIVQASGAPVRAADANTGAELAGAAMFVTNGTSNGGKRFLSSTSGSITIGVTAIDFVLFDAGASYAAGSGLTLSGSDFNVGAGTGIVVNADDVAIDTTVVARKYSVDIGNGAATSIVVTHNLGTKDISVTTRQVSDDALVQCDIVSTSTTTATLSFSVAPASNAIRVTIIG